jgi:hypothetical protein
LLLLLLFLLVMFGVSRRVLDARKVLLLLFLFLEITTTVTIEQ